MDATQKILRLASIRRFVDENMPDGMYFDVFEIKLPSEDGDYKEYEAVIPISSMDEKVKLEKLLKDADLNVAVVCL